MSQKKLFNRFINSISDFSFSNQFIKEKTGKAFSFMIVCFLFFSLITLGMYLFKIQPKINDGVLEAEEILNSLPDFELTKDGFEFNNPLKEGRYESDALLLVIDINDQEEIVFNKNDDKMVLHIDEKAIYINEVTALEYNLLTGSFNKEAIIDLIRSAETIAKIVLVIWLIVMFFFLLFLSTGAWLMVLFINGFLKKNIKKGDAYKVGVYAMTLPNVILSLLMFTGTSLPGFIFIYMGLLGFYSYVFLKNYRNADQDLLEIFE